MKRLNFFLSSLMATVMMFTGFTGGASASENIQVKVDGVAVQFPDAKPFIDSKSSRTLVPLRFISEKLGANVEWDQESQTVKIDKDGKQISLKVGETEASIGPRRIVLDTPAVIKQNRTFVPLRFISRAFDTLVRWDGKQRLVTVETNPVIKDVTGKDFPIQNGDQRFQTFHQNLQIKNGVLIGKVPTDTVNIRVNFIVYFKDGYGRPSQVVKPGESFSFNVKDINVFGITITDQAKKQTLASYAYRDLPDLTAENS